MAEVPGLNPPDAVFYWEILDKSVRFPAITLYFLKLFLRQPTYVKTVESAFGYHKAEAVRPLR